MTAVVPIDRASLARTAARMCPRRRRGLPCTWCDRLPPLEVHDPIAGGKIILTPSQRRPLRRDLERLVERWRR
jgi:hypothetical protein